MKKLAVDLLPPATLAAVVAFWGFAPASWVEGAWTLTWVNTAIALFVLALEQVFERNPGWRMNRRELVTDLFYFALFSTAISAASRILADEPMRAAKDALGIATPWAGQLPFLAQVALVVFLSEFGQYWMHRLMHNVTPFWLTHAPHHHITQLNAMKGAVGNPIELFLISLSVVALFDFSLRAELCAFAVTATISTFNHANVRSDPPLFYAFFFTTIRHHSLHHSVRYEDTRCNYGNSLILLDRVFGTYREGESTVVGQDDRKRLSIVEQWVFPFRPLIAWASGRGSAV